MAPKKSDTTGSKRAKSKKLAKSRKAKDRGRVTSANYDGKTPARVDPGSDEIEHTIGTKASHSRSKASTKSKEHKSDRKESGASDVDANAVPNPAPGTGSRSPAHLVVHSGVLPVSTTSTNNNLVPTLAPTSTAGFSPLPLAPLASLGTYTLSSSTLTSPTSSPTALTGQRSSSHQAPKHLSTVIIVLVVVGASFLLLGIYIVIRMCTRPRKRTHPTPSLPILQDAFPESKSDPDEESLFGGKERSSARPGSNNVLWQWTQYPHTSVHIKTAPASDGTRQQGGPHASRTSPKFNEKDSYPFTGLGVTAPQGTTQAPAPLQQQFQTALTRATNRVSAMSMSVYPGSPQSNLGNSGIGLALGCSSPLTADGLPVLQRSVSKPSARRYSKGAVRTTRQSGVDFDMATPRNPNVDEYDGADFPSPELVSPVAPKPAMTSSASVSGRARVKAPYAPAALLRSSATMANLASAPIPSPHANPFEQSLYVLPPISPQVKSDERKERDTKALTSAMGLTSPRPPPLSPQATLYPDDSITLAGDRRRSRAAARQSQVLSPNIDAGARLGNLMLADFQSMASLPYMSTRAGETADANQSGGMKARTGGRKRTEDKPPRVPSPPPMPSLAQMALAHTNPEDYADYRSPTYSIYGLYEADRKSRMDG